MTVSRIAPPAFLTDAALQAVLVALPEARLVGGCVRDAIAGTASADIDLATPRPPLEVIDALRQAGLKAVATGIAHGTVTAVSHGSGFEVTTLRRDLETDGRHAVVAFSDDWREDAARRDFTFNALSMQPDGTVHDYFGGIADLRAGRVRFVGQPADRVAEDRLRVLRYFRFYARYAALPPDAAIRAALTGAIPDLPLLSIERVWSELQRILQAPDPRAALSLMQDLGVLEAVLPEARDLGRLDRLVAAGAPADPLLRLAALVHSDPQSLAIRLRMSSAQQARLAAYSQGEPPHDGDTTADLARRLADTPRAVLASRAWLAGASAGLHARLAATPTPLPFPIEGRDVVSAGIPAGPHVGAVLRDLRAWWLAGGCVADHAACMAKLEAVIQANAGKLPNA